MDRVHQTRIDLRTSAIPPSQGFASSSQARDVHSFPKIWLLSILLLTIFPFFRHHKIYEYMNILFYKDSKFYVSMHVFTMKKLLYCILIMIKFWCDSLEKETTRPCVCSACFSPGLYGKTPHWIMRRTLRYVRSSLHARNCVPMLMQCLYLLVLQIDPRKVQ